MQRKQRFSAYQTLNTNGAASSDVITYEADGSKIRLGIFPRLNSGFPDIQNVEVKTRVKAPANFSMTRGGFTVREINNEPLFVYAVGIAGGILEPDFQPVENYQAVGIIANSRGEVVKVVVGDGSDVSENLASFAEYALVKFAFDKSAKPLESKHLVTKIHPVNEATLTHTFMASVLMPGGGSYEKPGNVKDLRGAGANPNANFSYWKRGWAWPRQGGNVVMVVEDFTGTWHLASFNDNGQKVRETHCSNIQTAIATANGI